jgi:transcriptional regulator with XRE-family HTH domain
VQISNLREWRERRALTQEELAEQAGVSARSVAGYEAGAGARPGTVRKLAAALDISVEDLLGKAEAPPSLEPTLFNGMLEEERRGYQSIAEHRGELLEKAATLWEKQITRGQYDLQTIREIDSVAFKLALTHALDENKIKRYCTQEQREQLERAEERLTEVYQVIWAAFEAKLEEEKSHLSREQVVELEQYRNERRHRYADTGT